MKKSLDKIAPIEEQKEPKRQNKSWYIGQLLKQRKSSETEKEHTLHTEKVNTGKHLPGNKTDTIKC